MNELFELLKENIGDRGSYTVSFNAHKSCYANPITYYKDVSEAWV